MHRAPWGHLYVLTTSQNPEIPSLAAWGAVSHSPIPGTVRARQHPWGTGSCCAPWLGSMRGKEQNQFL